MMQQKAKIILVTTEGCEGCRIQKNLLDKVYQDYKGKYDYIIIDRADIKETFKDMSNVETGMMSDFPTTVFCIDDCVITKLIGTKPRGILKQCVEDMLSKC